jgi:hypothetical protein
MRIPAGMLNVKCKSQANFLEGLLKTRGARVISPGHVMAVLYEVVRYSTAHDEPMVD